MPLKGCMVYNSLIMQDLRIYGLNIGAIIFSAVNSINPTLQTIVLLMTIVYTGIKIYQQLDGKD